MFEEDLLNCFNEFSIEAIHYFNNNSEVLNIIFDEKTEVIFETSKFETEVSSIVSS